MKQLQLRVELNTLDGIMSYKISVDLTLRASPTGGRGGHVQGAKICYALRQRC
jgi:hypothetical protein